MSAARRTAKRPLPPAPFAVKDCALATIATGRQAQNLRELHEGLLAADAACLFYHFWGGLLRPAFDDPEYRNDFAAWAAHGLHDPRLAERLGVLDPAAYPGADGLRHAVLEVVEERLEESEMVPWAKGDRQFHFLRAQIVVFRSGMKLASPEVLPVAVAEMSLGSVFYHFVDARRRNPDGRDDVALWLARFGAEYEDLAGPLAAAGRAFVSLAELRGRLTDVIHRRIGGPHP